MGDYRNSFLRSNAQVRVGQIPDLAMVFKKSYHNYFDAQTYIFMQLTKKQIFPRFSFSYSRYFCLHVMLPNLHSRASITITISDQLVPQQFDLS